MSIDSLDIGNVDLQNRQNQNRKGLPPRNSSAFKNKRDSGYDNDGGDQRQNRFKKSPKNDADDLLEDYPDAKAMKKKAAEQLRAKS